MLYILLGFFFFATPHGSCDFALTGIIKFTRMANCLVCGGCVCDVIAENFKLFPFYGMCVVICLIKLTM